MQPETSYPAIIGRVLEHLRKENNLDQQTVAEFLGLTQSAWSRIERGQSGISIEQLVGVSNLFGTQPHNILADADRAKAGLENQGVKVFPHVIAKPSDATAFIALAALGALVFAILSSK